MVRKSGNRFSEKIMLKQKTARSGKVETGFPKRSCSNKKNSMNRKSGNQFSDKIMLKQKFRAGYQFNETYPALKAKSVARA